MRQSPELQREHTRDLICAWALATEALLRTADPDALERIFTAAQERAAMESGSDDQLRAAVNGSLAAEIFSPEFLQQCRRELVAGDEW